MERNGTAEEKNDYTGKIVSVVSKSVASPIVKIDSISIDIGKSMDKKSIEKCHHFSIRGYCAEMRKKDVRICAPFASDGDDEIKLREQLVPLHVPKFRWWYCPSCRVDDGAASASESQQNKENLCPSLNRDEVRVSPCGLTVVCGQEKGIISVSNQQISNQTSSLLSCPQGPVSERHTDDSAGGEDSTGRELANISVPEAANHLGARNGLATELPACQNSRFGEMCVADKDDTVNEEAMTVVVANEISTRDIQIDASTSTSTSTKDAEAMKQVTAELQKCDNGFKKSSKTVIGDSHQTKQHEFTANSTRRKRKVRLIADILNVDCEERSDRLASYNATPNDFSAPASASAQHKRKTGKDLFREMRHPDSQAKKVRISKGDAKTTIATIHHSDSESEEDDASAGTGLRSNMPLQQSGNGSSNNITTSRFEDRQGSNISIPRRSSKEHIGLNLSLNSFMVVEKINTLTPDKETPIINDNMRKEGNCISQSSAPELSFSKDIEVDISGNISYKTDIMCEQENGLSLHKKLDLALGCSNRKATAPEGCLQVIRNNTDQRSEMIFGKRSYDDIPMEIVELMARHQYERGLSEAERNSCLTKRIDERNYEMMGYSDVNGHGMRSLQKEHSQWNHVNLPSADNNPSVVGNSDGSRVSHVFGAYPLTDLRTFVNNDTQNCLWSGDKLVNTSTATGNQVSVTQHTSHNGLQHGGISANFWASGPSNLVSQGSNFSQNVAGQRCDMTAYIPSPELHKGKTVRDLDLNFADPNDQDVGLMPVCPFVANTKGRDLEQKNMESLHSFSSETIPAMQLLSLMDAETQSRPSFGIEAEKDLENPFQPHNPHPNRRMNERASLITKPLFPQNHLVNENSESGFSIYRSNACTRHVSSAYYGSDIVIPQQPENGIKTCFTQQNTDWRSKTPVGTSGIPDVMTDCNPYQAKQKGILGTSADVVVPLQHVLKITENHKDVGSCHMHGTLEPLRDTSKEEVCNANRNPADFTIPGAENRFMIEGANLIFSNDFTNSRINLFDGQSRPMLTRITASNGQAVSWGPTRFP